MARRASTSTPSRRRRGGKKGGTSIDFTGVEGRTVIPDGQYKVVVEEIAEEQGDKGPYFQWKFKTSHPKKKYDNKILYTNTSLAPQALWRLKTLLECLGVEVPDGPMDIDLSAMVGLECMADVEVDDEYDGKPRSVIQDFGPLGDDDEDDGEDIEDEEDDDEDEEEEEEKPTRRGRRSSKAAPAKKPARRRRSKKDEDEEDEEEVEVEDEDDEDEDDDEDGLTVEDIEDMSTKELEEVNTKYKLKVNLKRHRTGRKKINAILDALREKGLIEEDDD